MRVWRLARRPHAALDGEGARRYGGRWNSPGVPVVYSATTLSLAVLEYLTGTDSDLLPADLVQLEIDVPDALRRTTIVPRDLPARWRTEPALTRAEGDAWAAALATPLLLVPSVIIPGERNLLINPRHRSARRVRTIDTQRFHFDARLLRRRTKGFKPHR